MHGLLLMKKFWLILASILVILLIAVAALLFSRGNFPLHRLDDHPFYVMHYAGDYGFAQYLQTGIYPGETTLQKDDIHGAWGCTVFATLNLTGERLLGRNFDWYADHPIMLLFTDPSDGYASVSMVDLWYLDYTDDSIGIFERQALSQAPLIPFDGMNEMGVAVGMMSLPYGNGIRDPSLFTLQDLDVIRLVLDYAANVDEAVELLEGYNVEFNPRIPLHYLIADAGGHGVVIEYVGGEMRVLRNENPWQVATNFVISDERPTAADSSCDRYNTSYQILENHDGSLDDSQAMALLGQVSQAGRFPTIWSVLYNLTTGQVRVAIDRNYDELYTFQLEMKPTP